MYTYCRIAHDDALPLVRPLYLEHPGLPEAYEHPDEYYFGSELLVAPVVTDQDQRNVYLPPGEWTDFNTGDNHVGGTTVSVRAPVDQIPVFVRSGSIIPMGKSISHAGTRSDDSLSIDFYGPGAGSFRLYEDDGVSLEYRSDKFAWTPMTCGPGGSKGYRCAIGPTTGTYTGQTSTRAWTMILHGLDRPTSVSVTANSRPLDGSKWSWDEHARSIVITTPAQNIRTSIQVEVR